MSPMPAKKTISLQKVHFPSKPQAPPPENDELFTSHCIPVTKANREALITALEKSKLRTYSLRGTDGNLKNVHFVEDPNFRTVTLPFTFKDAALIWHAAERFNDPTAAKLSNRTREEHIKIFDTLTSSPRIYEKFEQSYRYMSPKVLKEIMIQLPFTTEEDGVIKTLSSFKRPTEAMLQGIQEKLPHFRGRRAIEHRYFELLKRNELNDQSNPEPKLLPEDYVIASDMPHALEHYKYLTSCFNRELSSRMHQLEKYSNNLVAKALKPTLPHDVLGHIELNQKTHKIRRKFSYIALDSGKLQFVSKMTLHQTYLNHIVIVIDKKSVTFTNVFDNIIIIDGQYVPKAQTLKLPNNGIHTVVIVDHGFFTYTPNQQYDFDHPKSSQSSINFAVKPVPKKIKGSSQGDAASNNAIIKAPLQSFKRPVGGNIVGPSPEHQAFSGQREVLKSTIPQSEVQTEATTSSDTVPIIPNIEPTNVVKGIAEEEAAEIVKMEAMDSETGMAKKDDEDKSASTEVLESSPGGAKIDEKTKADVITGELKDDKNDNPESKFTEEASTFKKPSDVPKTEDTLKEEQLKALQAKHKRVKYQDYDENDLTSDYAIYCKLMQTSYEQFGKYLLQLRKKPEIWENAEMDPNDDDPEIAALAEEYNEQLRELKKRERYINPFEGIEMEDEEEIEVDMTQPIPKIDIKERCKNLPLFKPRFQRHLTGNRAPLLPTEEQIAVYNQQRLRRFRRRRLAGSGDRSVRLRKRLVRKARGPKRVVQKVIVNRPSQDQTIHAQPGTYQRILIRDASGGVRPVLVQAQQPGGPIRGLRPVEYRADEPGPSQPQKIMVTTGSRPGMIQGKPPSRLPLPSGPRPTTVVRVPMSSVEPQPRSSKQRPPLTPQGTLRPRFVPPQGPFGPQVARQKLVRIPVSQSPSQPQVFRVSQPVKTFRPVRPAIIRHLPPAQPSTSTDRLPRVPMRPASRPVTLVHSRPNIANVIRTINPAARVIPQGMQRPRIQTIIKRPSIIRQAVPSQLRPPGEATAANVPQSTASNLATEANPEPPSS